MINSLKALSEQVNGNLDYSISIMPDRGEFVSLTDYDKKALSELWLNRENCPLTGTYYDIDVIEGLYLEQLESQVLTTLHKQGEYLYSNEGLQELCEANGYEFYEDGKFYT